MAATEILVSFRSVDVLACDSNAEWSFQATVRRMPSGTSKTAGDPAATFEVRKKMQVSLAFMPVQIKIQPDDTKIEIELKGVERRLLGDRDLGSVKATLNVPIRHGYDLWLRSGKNSFTACMNVKVTKDADTTPGEITTILAHRESSSYNTVHDGMLTMMARICPVIPPPMSNNLPPIPRGVEPFSESEPEVLHVSAGEAKLNALVNPSLIPVLSPSHGKFNDLCARIRITHIRPKNLKLENVIWKAKTDNIRFFDGGAGKAEVKGGREVKAYGVLKGNADEEGEIELRWDGEGQPLLAVYRAWVGKPKYIWTRANIIKWKGKPAARNPKATPADVKYQIAYNNVFLWQAGILMVMDNDTTVNNGAVRKDAGIFEIETDDNCTFNVPDAPDIVAPLLNQREKVFNVAYIHSVDGTPNLLGMATDRRLSIVERQVVQRASPSVSWVRPSGVYPDDDAQPVKMKTMGPSDARDEGQKDLAGDGKLGSLCCCIMTRLSTNARDDNTLVHELGHVIGLHHRGCGGNQVKESYDGVNHAAGPRKGWGHPWEENVMTYGPNSRAQDFDLVQTRVMRYHALLRNAPPPPPVPSAPPPPVQPAAPPAEKRKPVPGAGLPTVGDRILLQEYLCGKKKGLKRGPYDIGKYGAGGDGVDGLVGPKTREAVRSFQRDHGGLFVDGVYGPKTRAAFDKEINGP